MKQGKKNKSRSVNVAKAVRKRIEKGGDRIWRLTDFKNLPFAAVAQALSRLARKGIIHRLSKGLYYRSRPTAFGESKPSPAQLRLSMGQEDRIFPAGNSAASLLGFTTQNAAKIEIATNKLSLPRSMIGRETIIHTRRPESWEELTPKDAAILDFLRQSGKSSELLPDETADKILQHFRKKGQLKRLMHVARSEPPRVRAMLGAIAQQIGCPKNHLIELKKSLNPLSRFDFGNLISLKYAKEWQAK